MNASHIESHKPAVDKSIESHRLISSARRRAINRGIARQIIPFPNTNETIERALIERDAYNANEAAIDSLRIEMGKYGISRHDEIDQLESTFIRQNNQIKKGLLSLHEIQGKDLA